MNKTHNLTIEQRKQMTWPIEQVTDSQVVFVRAKQSEKENRQLTNRLRGIEKDIDCAYYHKSDIHNWVMIIFLAITVGLLFGLVYREAGWSQWLLAGYLTAGITVPACIYTTLAFLDWKQSRQ